MIIETNITLPSKLFRKNNLDIDCQVNVNLTNYKIHAELFDQYGMSIKLNTVDNGGSTSEISITSASAGTFALHFLKDTMNLFHLVSYLEITLIGTSSGKEQTVWFDVIKFEDNVYLRG